MLTEIEQQNLDIDWFFTDGQHIGFVASGGGRLPNSIAKEDKNIEILSSYFRNLPERTEIEINNELKDIMSDVTEMYLSDFTLMAKKGLYTFDKTTLNNFLEPNYHLVAKPINALKIQDLSIQIQDIIVKTKYTRNIEFELKIDTINIQ